jgi:hypothetical protein
MSATENQSKLERIWKEVGRDTAFCMKRTCTHCRKAFFTRLNQSKYCTTECFEAILAEDIARRNAERSDIPPPT